MIDISEHAWEQIKERGATEAEAHQTIQRGQECEAGPPRLGMEMVFTAGYNWKDSRYPHKRVMAIYAPSR